MAYWLWSFYASLSPRMLVTPPDNLSCKSLGNLFPRCFVRGLNLSAGEAHTFWKGSVLTISECQLVHRMFKLKLPSQRANLVFYEKKVSDLLSLRSATQHLTFSSLTWLSSQVSQKFADTAELSNCNCVTEHICKVLRSLIAGLNHAVQVHAHIIWFHSWLRSDGPREHCDTVDT